MTDTPVGSGVPRDAKEKINLGIKLHDIGKIMMPKAILNKAGKLTLEEYDVIKTHTICGGKLLEKIPGFTSHPARAYVCDIVRHHHERWDGNGYPDGLKGDEISIWVQAMSMADGECGKFNPNMLQFFFEAEPNFRKLYVEGP